MPGVGVLPPEVLQDIIFQLSSPADLLNCSIANRALSAAVVPALYGHIDLTKAEDIDDEGHVQIAKRQLRLLCSVADIHNLGAFVKIFHWGQDDEPWRKSPGIDTDPAIDIAAAQNLKNLASAHLGPNLLAIQIIANLQNYPYLKDLTIDGINPEFYIWNNAPTSLRSLKWEITPGSPSLENTNNPTCHWDKFRFLINVVEATCPDLESLEVSFQVNRTAPTNWSPIEPDRAQQYRTLDGTHVPVLKKLRHIGLQDEKWSILQQELLKFIGKYRLTLTSAIIPINCGKLTRSTLDFIL